MTSTRKLYLSSGDRFNLDELSASADFQLNASELAVDSPSQGLRVCLSQASLPSNLAASQSTTSRAVGQFQTNTQSCASFNWFFNKGGGSPPARYTLFFNDITNDPPPANQFSMPLTVQTSVQDILDGMNAAMGETANPILLVDTAAEEYGQFRLKFVSNNSNEGTRKLEAITIGGSTENKRSVELALGVPNTIMLINFEASDVTGSLPLLRSTQFDYNAALFMPVVYITSSLNTNTHATSEGLNNVLASVPLRLEESSPPIFTDTVFPSDGSPLTLLRSYVWNYQPFITEGSHKSIPNRDISNISIQLRNDEGFVLYGGCSPFSVVLEVQTVDAVGN